MELTAPLPPTHLSPGFLPHAQPIRSASNNVPATKADLVRQLTAG